MFKVTIIYMYVNLMSETQMWDLSLSEISIFFILFLTIDSIAPLQDHLNLSLWTTQAFKVWESTNPHNVGSGKWD